MNINEAIAAILDIFPDAEIEDDDGELIVATRLRFDPNGKNGELIPYE